MERNLSPHRAWNTVEQDRQNKGGFIWYPTNSYLTWNDFIVVVGRHPQIETYVSIPPKKRSITSAVTFGSATGAKQ